MAPSDLLTIAWTPAASAASLMCGSAKVVNIKIVEVGLAGHEGFVGLPLIAGFRSSASRVVTQGEGNAFRINADDMREALRKCPQLIVSLLRYSQEATMEVTQIAA